MADQQHQDAKISLLVTAMCLTAESLISDRAGQSDDLRSIARELENFTTFIDFGFQQKAVNKAASSMVDALEAIPADGEFREAIADWVDELNLVIKGETKPDTVDLLQSASNALYVRADRMDRAANQMTGRWSYPSVATPAVPEWKAANPKGERSSVPKRFDQHDSRLGSVLAQVIANAQHPHPKVSLFDKCANAMTPVGSSVADPAQSWVTLRVALKSGSARLSNAPKISTSLGIKPYAEVKIAVEVQIVSAAQALASELGIAISGPKIGPELG